LKNQLTLIGVDIEGEWNLPLLQNAADMSGAGLRFAKAGGSPSGAAAKAYPVSSIDEVLDQFDHVIACEAAKGSRAVYEYPAPRGHVGVMVGNELSGIPVGLLKKADQVVSIPMFGRGMSSVNVAVAAAIVLYALQRDLGRRPLRASALSQRDVDVLVLGSSDPNELGSLFRSAWAFGWKRIFLTDTGGAWFSRNRATLLAARAAARREVNPLAVVSQEHLDLEEYDRVFVCDSTTRGTPLSRFSLPDRGKALVVYGDGGLPCGWSGPVEQVLVDYAAPDVTACFRHTGSILLSALSQCLRRGRRG
jgi:tRNA(Leu) C34 or U34 (ribose-2'-O)-methylase TrmL